MSQTTQSKSPQGQSNGPRGQSRVHLYMDEVHQVESKEVIVLEDQEENQ